jgi:hypothetical protein
LGYGTEVVSSKSRLVEEGKERTKGGGKNEERHQGLKVSWERELPEMSQQEDVFVDPTKFAIMWILRP